MLKIAYNSLHIYITMYFIPLSVNDKICKKSQENIFKRNTHMFSFSRSFRLLVFSY